MVMTTLNRSISALLCSCLLLIQFTANAQSKDDNKSTEKFLEILHIINYAYVDETDNGELIEDAINGMLKELDPHSVYIPKDELNRMNEPLMGNFEGVGIQFNLLMDTILVVSTISGGPSEKIGIKAGDKIIKVEKDLVAGVEIKRDEVIKKLRGSKGSIVNVSVKRRGNADLIEFEIVRDKIPINSMDAAYMISPKTAYLKINRFSKITMEEYHQAMDDLDSGEIENMILDLRGNGGGYLNKAIELADEFIDKKKLIVYTEGDKQSKRTYKASRNGRFEKGKLVLLIDEGSASASEIVVGAIQDWDRGLVIGRRSFGKGLVQKPYSLFDGSAVRLTTARYYTPSGRCIQKPYDDGTEKYREEISERFEHGEFMYSDSIQLPDSLRYETAGKRSVYGGGGIMPDLFVPMDTSRQSAFHKLVRQKGVIYEYCMLYVDQHRDSLKSAYEQFEQFDRQFDAETILKTEFLAYMAEKDLTPSADEPDSDPLLYGQIKAIMARHMYGNEAYYKVMNHNDPMVIQALKSIEGEDELWSKLSYN